MTPEPVKMTWAEAIEQLFKERYTGVYIVHASNGHPCEIHVPSEPRIIRIDNTKKRSAH